MIQSAATHKVKTPPVRKLAKKAFPSPIVAVADEPVEASDDDAPPTREELLAKADELGLEYRKNISDKNLLALIEAKLDSEAEV